MATVNGQEISNKYGGGIVFANNFTVNTNTPLDVRLTKTTKSELLDPTSWVRNSNGQYLVYTGMLVVVTSDTTASNNGIWEYVGPDDVATANPTLETNWVHLISGETTNTTINAAIDAKIQGLDVDGYAQATITTNTPVGGEPNSTLTISGIQEVDGKISNDSSKNFEVAIDGGYNKETNKIATESTVTNAIKGAIEGLDVQTPIQAVTFNTNTPENGGNTNTTLTFKGVKEENGKIVEGNGTDTFIVGDAKLKIQIGSATATNVFSANAQSDSTIKLDGNVFKKNEDVISVITKTAVTSTNKLITEQDIADLPSAMQYKGAITSDNSSTPDNWPRTVAAGDVYIATGDFEKEGQVIESGDMIVFNTDNDNSNFTVVQSNITLGTGAGQIAKNDGDLVDGKLVVATQNGIKTIGINGSQLIDDDNNKRELSYRNGTPDTDTTNNITLHHDVTIKDAFTVIGKDFTKSINISSANRSIEIAANGDTGVVVDLVWNTTIE